MDIREIRTFEMLWHPLPDDHESVTDKWQMPIVAPVRGIVPHRMMAFDEFARKRPKDCAVHCFKGDHLLERAWQRPWYYAQRFQGTPFVIAPDFSASLQMPLFPLGYNLFRAKRMAQIWAQSGLVVVPPLIWATQDTYELCFDGLPLNSFVAVSTVGTINDSLARTLFPIGLREAIRRLRPIGIILYGPLPQLGFHIDIPVWHFNRQTYGLVKGYQEELF